MTMDNNELPNEIALRQKTRACLYKDLNLRTVRAGRTCTDDG